jgi:hypothetical protein
LDEEFDAFNRIAVEETFGIIIVRVLWNSQKIVTHLAQFPTVDAYSVHQQNLYPF